MHSFSAAGRLVHGARRRAYWCRPPTLASVLAAHARFWPEIIALWRVHQAAPLRPADLLARGVSALRCRPRDAAEVLALCADSPGLDRAGVAERLYRHPRDIPAVAAAVLTDAPLVRLWAFLAPQDDAGKPTGESVTAGYLAVARYAGLSPVELMDAPAEAVLDTLDALRHEADEDEPAAEVEAPGVTLIGKPGVH